MAEQGRVRQVTMVLGGEASQAVAVLGAGPSSRLLCCVSWAHDVTMVLRVASMIAGIGDMFTIF